MKFLVIFAAALLCVHAVRVPYIIPDSSEEEYHVLLPTNGGQGQLDLSGLGIVNQPVVQAVKVKVPRYADPWLKQQLIQQFLAPHGLTLQGNGGQGFSVQGLEGQGLRTHGQGVQGVNAQGLGTQNLPTQGLGAKDQGAKISGVERQDTQAAVAQGTPTPGPETQRLPTQRLPVQNLGGQDLARQNLLTQELLLRNLLLQNPNNQGWGYFNIDVPNDAIQAPNAFFNLQLRNRRLAEEDEISTTASSLETTTVPDVIETTTTTVTELPEIEDVTTITNDASPVSSTKMLAKRQTETKGDATNQQKTKSLSKTHTRPSRAVPFNIKIHIDLKKMTPVPPIPQMDISGPKMSDLPRLRGSRAVKPSSAVESSTVGVVAQGLTTQKNCDIECTKLQYTPVCAFNGECYHEFANECVMDTFVCKRPDLGFKTTPRERCQMHWLKRCSADELKSSE